VRICGITSFRFLAPGITAPTRLGMQRNAILGPHHIVHVYTTLCLFTPGKLYIFTPVWINRVEDMEHLIRIVNDNDRQTLAWLRTHVGDARLSAAARQLTAHREQFVGVRAKPYLSAVCRYLGVWPPAPRRSTRSDADHRVADQHLARIRQLLAPHSTAARKPA
jgi:hypothetical protein